MSINRVRAGFLVAAALLLISAPARAADLRDLLRRSAGVDRTRSYQGRKVLTRYVDGVAFTTTYKVFHKAPDRTLMEGIQGDHAGARLLQIGRDHYLRLAGWRAHHQPPLPAPLDNTEDLLRNYTIRQQRIEQIARRRCVMIQLSPKSKGNPSKLVWLDVATGLALKTQIRAADGELSEEAQFLLIDYNPKFRSGMFALKGSVVYEWPRAEPDFEVAEVRQGGLPAGYTLKETLNRRAPDGRILSFQRFSDGLNTLTLIQSRTHPDPGAVGGSPAVRGKVGRVNYAICGEHNPAALRKIAKSLRGRPLSIHVVKP